jgi:hypothetical protein
MDCKTRLDGGWQRDFYSLNAADDCCKQIGKSRAPLRLEPACMLSCLRNGKAMSVRSTDMAMSVTKKS